MKMRNGHSSSWLITVRMVTMMMVMTMMRKEAPQVRTMLYSQNT